MVGRVVGTTGSSGAMAPAIATGALAGGAGTIVMTALHRLVEDVIAKTPPFEPRRHECVMI